MAIKFKEVKPPKGTNPASKTFRTTVNIRKPELDTDTIQIRNEYRLIGRSIPSTKTSVTCELFYKKEEKGYYYKVKAYPEFEREKSAWRLYGYIEAENFEEAEKELKQQALKQLCWSLMQEANRLMEQAYKVLEDIK